MAVKDSKYLYHATGIKNLNSILEKGLLKGVDGIVYLTETTDDALKFMAFRELPEVLVLEIKRSALKKKLIIETFDHSQAFFGCRSWGYTENIPSKSIHRYIRYQRGL